MVYPQALAALASLIWVLHTHLLLQLGASFKLMSGIGGWNYAVGILISCLASAQPSSGSHWSCLQNDSLACSQTCLITLDLLCYCWALTCPGLSSPNLILILICGFYFMAWPQTCHVTMDSPGNLDPLLTIAAISEPMLLIFLSQCGAWALPCQSRIVLNSWLPFP